MQIISQHSKLINMDIQITQKKIQFYQKIIPNRNKISK